MTNFIAASLLALLISSPAFAQSEQAESHCLFLDRECLAQDKIQQRKVAREQQEAARREMYLQEKAKHEASRESEVQLRVEQAAQARREADEQKQAKAEEERQKREAKYQQLKAEQARQQAEMEAEAAAEERRERAAKKKRDADVAELKSRCGSDYKTPSIGMTIGRVQECVGPVKLSGQVNRADGVASVYSYGALWLNVMNGRVVAWGR